MFILTFIHCHIVTQTSILLCVYIQLAPSCYVKFQAFDSWLILLEYISVLH